VIANILRVDVVILAATLLNDPGIGADHIVFGWAFYALLVIALIAIGRRFADATGPGAPSPAPTAAKTGAGGLAAACALFAVTGAFARFVVDGPVTEEAPIIAPLNAPGWRTLAPDPGWRAALAHADGRLATFYQRDHDAAQVEIGYFTHDRPGAEVAGRDVRSYDGTTWRRVGGKRRAVFVFGGVERVRVDLIENTAGARLYAATLYFLDRETFADPVAMKLRQARLRLLGRRPRAGALIVAAPTAEALDGFLAAVEPLSDWLARIDAARES
jgi:EpsI family protein